MVGGGGGDPQEEWWSVGALKDGSGVLVRSVLQDGLCPAGTAGWRPVNVILAINGEKNQQYDPAPRPGPCCADTL
ncbi:unnamed protein product [Arctogadus glacialis]